MIVHIYTSTTDQIIPCTSNPYLLVPSVYYSYFHQQWLVEEQACIFNGFDDYYIGTNNLVLYTAGTKIYCVEQWGSIKENLGKEKWGNLVL